MADCDVWQRRSAWPAVGWPKWCSCWLLQVQQERSARKLGLQSAIRIVPNMGAQEVHRSRTRLRGSPQAEQAGSVALATFVFLAAIQIFVFWSIGLSTMGEPCRHCCCCCCRHRCARNLALQWCSERGRIWDMRPSLFLSGSKILPFLYHTALFIICMQKLRRRRLLSVSSMLGAAACSLAAGECHGGHQLTSHCWSMRYLCLST